MPELRLVDQNVWDAVKMRQSAMKASRFAKGQPGYWDRRRPRYLFSGLMKCAECGGGVIYYNKAYVGCATARNKGTCTNKISMRRDIDKLVQAILDGVPGSQVKDRMAALEERKGALERQLDQAEEMPLLLHPNLLGFYREQIGRLKEALTDECAGGRAADAMRALIDWIELVPAEYEGRKILEMNLHGRLAGILPLAINGDKPLDERDLSMDVVKLVAGACNRRYQQGLLQAAAQGAKPDHEITYAAEFGRKVSVTTPVARPRSDPIQAEAPRAAASSRSAQDRPCCILVVWSGRHQARLLRSGRA